MLLTCRKGAIIFTQLLTTECSTHEMKQFAHTECVKKDKITLTFIINTCDAF